MDTRIEITEAGILEALRAALERAPDDPSDAFTVNELSEQLGSTEDTIRRHLRSLAKTGDMVSVRVRRRAIDGRLCRVPGYRIKPRLAD